MRKPADHVKAMPYTLALAGGKALSANFKVREFACHDGTDTVFIADELVTLLQAIRDHFGKPVTINSGYRTETWNTRNGGSPRSQHKYGRAADICINGVTPQQIAAYAKTLMPDWGGVGVYPTFCHVDVRAGKGRW